MLSTQYRIGKRLKYKLIGCIVCSQFITWKGDEVAQSAEDFLLYHKFGHVSTLYTRNKYIFRLSRSVLATVISISRLNVSILYFPIELLMFSLRTVASRAWNRQRTHLPHRKIEFQIQLSFCTKMLKYIQSNALNQNFIRKKHKREHHSIYIRISNNNRHT